MTPNLVSIDWKSNVDFENDIKRPEKITRQLLMEFFKSKTFSAIIFFAMKTGIQITISEQLKFV